MLPSLWTTPYFLLSGQLGAAEPFSCFPPEHPFTVAFHIAENTGGTLAIPE